MGSAQTPRKIAASLGQSLDEVAFVVGILVDAGFAEQHDPSAPCREPVALRQWEFHDLLFHTRSRLGRHDQDAGATYRFRGLIEPQPALRGDHEGPTWELARPTERRGGALFAEVLERRTSIRDYGSVPLSAAQLGEFLYHAARVRQVRETADPPNAPMSRPYPSAGALYDLEIYVTVNRCRDLVPGCYHYAPDRHQLVLLRTAPQDVDRLLADAAFAAAIDHRPDVLLTFTSRFQRVSWKYSSIAYALVLKNVGALIQTMCLVATAMDLAACPLGNGDSARAANAFGLDPWAESSVGELMLGSLPLPEEEGT
jgi:SagB-type dehydrogenase family enzyme